MESVKTITVGEVVGTIVYDTDSGNSPRDWDNLGTMICFHKNYNLGDKHDYRVRDYDSHEELEKGILKDYGNDAIILPIYGYEHGGLTINTTGFSCPWDSGQLGFIVVSRDKIRKEFSKKKVSPKLKSKVIDILKSEVKIYDQYLQGEVYGYTITKGDEDLDSCWGYYGLDDLIVEVTDLVNHFANKE